MSSSLETKHTTDQKPRKYRGAPKRKTVSLPFFLAIFTVILFAPLCVIGETRPTMIFLVHIRYSVFHYKETKQECYLIYSAPRLRDYSFCSQFLAT